MSWYDRKSWLKKIQGPKENSKYFAKKENLKIYLGPLKNQKISKDEKLDHFFRYQSKGILGTKRKIRTYFST